MKVTFVSRGGREIINGLELNDLATVGDLQEAIYRQSKKYYPSRQRLTLHLPSGSKIKHVVLKPRKKIQDYCDGSSDNLTVMLKDLGPQVSYRALLFWEYVGSLLIYLMFYYLPVYHLLFGYEGERVIHHQAQTFALYYWCFHYLKRIMEIFFVQRFRRDSTSLSNVFRHCAYYWTFGSFIAYHVNHPLYGPVSDLQMKIGFGFGLACQIGNFYCHLILKNLGSANGNGNEEGGCQIPHGFLFNMVTCANYTTEIYQWLGFNIATQTVAGYVFLVFDTLIRSNRALARHCRLTKLFDGKEGRPKYPERWVILPPLL